MTWIQTISGGKLDFQSPDPADIHLTDIATVLSRIPRFAGHTVDVYTVAQHSLLVSQNLPPEWQLAGLLHDAHEAYVGDLPSPLKRFCPGYKLIEDRVQRAIEEKFGLPAMSLRVGPVRQMDLVVLATEKRDLLLPEPEQWDPLPEPLAEKISANGNSVDLAKDFVYVAQHLMKGI